MTEQNRPDGDVKRKLDRLTAEFYRCVSFKWGRRPPYADLYGLFKPSALLIWNAQPAPKIFTLSQFIERRQKIIDSGVLTTIKELEVAESTEIFGNVAQRLSSYEKTGKRKGKLFHTYGMISTQFVVTPAGWKISAMARDETTGESIREACAVKIELLANSKRNFRYWFA
jgi:hypothetical protein